MYLYNQHRLYPPETRGMSVSELPELQACSCEGYERQWGEVLSECTEHLVGLRFCHVAWKWPWPPVFTCSRVDN